MWWAPWISSTALLGGAVLLSYAVVLFDAAGAFPLPATPGLPAPPAAGLDAYLRSPFWLGLPRATVGALSVFQVLGVVGYVVWQWALVAERPAQGLLADERWLLGANVAFLGGSLAWPLAAYRLLLAPDSLGAALSAAASLWTAAAAMLLLVAGTFEDTGRSPLALVGILLTSVVVVVVDGAGWSAVAIRGAVRGAGG